MTTNTKIQKLNDKLEIEELKMKKHRVAGNEYLENYAQTNIDVIKLKLEQLKR